MFRGEAITCLVNPLAGREAELDLAEQEESCRCRRRTGRLYAAYVCALLGHDVTLYEEKEMLGGNMRLAAYPPGKDVLMA